MTSNVANQKRKDAVISEKIDGAKLSPMNKTVELSKYADLEL